MILSQSSSVNAFYVLFKGVIGNNDPTGSPTKDATSTTTVEGLSSLVLTNSVDCNRSP